MAYSGFSQEGIRSRCFSPNEKIQTNFANDNLFAGVWRLNNENLDRFDPFVQGWAAIIWTKCPEFFKYGDGGKRDVYNQFKYLTERNFKSLSGIGDITLESDNMSSGFTGNELPVATSMKKENTSFTLKHYEFSGSPIRELYQFWITGIRDPETGIATYHGAIKSQELIYSMKNHTGEILYTVTDASFAIGGGADSIEFAAYYTNVFPTKIPQDHLNYTAGDHGLTEIDQEFKANFHTGRKVNQLAVQALKTYTITKTYGDYNPATGGAVEIGNGYNEDWE